jgi:hypothetical protein
MRSWNGLLVPLLLIGWLVCGPNSVAGQTSQPAPRYGEPQAVCQINDRRLDEASGLVASRRNSGYYYTHNDSQGRPQVYVLNRYGRICLTIHLVGAENRDWEDIALAPGDQPGTFDVCVADIGDNKAERNGVVFYRFPEPRLDAAARARGTLDVRPRVFRCVYKDGARNAEGFAVDPRTGDAYVFTKRFDGACHVYRFAAPWDAAAVTTLERVGKLRFPPAAALARMVTGADISPDGTRLVTRSYVGGWEWRLAKRDAADAFALVFEQMPTTLELATEPQGEALCFSADGKALLTVSEGTPTTLYEVRQVGNGGGAEP